MGERTLTDIVTDIIILSVDPALMQDLPVALGRLDASVHVEVVSTVEQLEQRINERRPDAVILDVGALGEVPLPAFLREQTLATLPVLVVDDRDDAAHRDWVLGLGASNYVSRRPENMGPLSQSAIVTGRIARIDGELLETERHYREILEALSDGVFVLIGGKFRYVNRAFAAFVGQGVEDLLGTDGFTDIVPQQERAPMAEHLASLERGDVKRLTFETQLQASRNEHAFFEIQCHVSTVQGHSAIVGVARDVTTARKLQVELEQTRQRAAQIERLRALGEIAAGMAHDFNNALGALMGRLSLAHEKASRGENIAEELAVTFRAAQQASRTVERIQKLSRPSGSDTWEDVDLESVIGTAAALIRTRIPRGVTFNVDAKATPLVRGNPAELLDVLVNLLRNALDAVGDKGVVTLKCHERGGKAQVSVEDNGSGLDEATKSRIFEPFFTTKGEQGTGLGLSVAHWILRRHDAHIEIDSTPGHGARFCITFTAKDSVANTRTTPQTQDRWPLSGKNQLNILVVDDDPGVGEMMEDLLRDQGHLVKLTRNAKDARAALQHQTFDVVLTDLDLPDMSGWELARAAHANTPEMLVGLLTGWPVGADEIELKARGVDFVLQKPFSLEALNTAFAQLGVNPERARQR